MEKLTKIFQSGEVLKAQDLNSIKDKVNELVDGIDSGATITVDSQLSQTSANPVQNKVLSAKIKELQDAIDNIKSGLIIAEDMDATFSLTSISINNGASSTSELSASVRFTYSGGTPTHYMLSESPSFTGASWIPFTNPASFTLSRGDGSKTIYAKIKNASGESAVKNDSITYSSALELALTSVSINNGAISTDNLNVDVQFAYSGNPTHYMLSESPTFAGASWIAFINPASLTLSTGEGNKTVYAKIKDATKESYVVNDSINYTSVVALTLNSISINNGASSTSESSVSVNFTYSGTPTHYMLSESPSFTGASWISFANPASFVLSDGNGSKTIYAKIKDASGQSSVKSDSITYSQQVSGNVYFTDAEFKRVMVNKYDKDGDGELSISEAEAVKSWGSEMMNNTSVVNMDALKYFKNASPSIQSALTGCVSLESIEYPDGWEMKGSELKGNTSLSHVKLPANLVTIPTSAFENCSSLERIDLPSALVTISVNAFLNSGLTEIIVPDTVTDIGNLGYNCTKLTYADLGAKVTNIGVNSFVDSPIETLICRAVTPPVMGYAALNKTTPQIYVPDESVAKYKAATPWWSAHAAQIHPLSEYQG